MENEAIYERCVALWGRKAQWGMVQEECAELIVAVNKWDRNKIDANAVFEEIADVLIMCEQAACMMGKQPAWDEVLRIKREKLKRLENSITPPPTKEK